MPNEFKNVSPVSSVVAGVVVEQRVNGEKHDHPRSGIFPKLQFANRPDTDPANIFLHGAHLLDVVGANLTLMTKSFDQGVIAGNVKEYVAKFSRYVNTMKGLSIGMSEALDLTEGSTATVRVRSRADALTLFFPGEKEDAIKGRESFYRFIENHQFGDEITAADLVLGYLNKTMAGIAGQIVTYEEPNIRELATDTDPAVAQQEEQLLFKLISHDWKTPITTFSAQGDLATRALEKNNHSGAVTRLERSIALITSGLDGKRAKFYKLLSEGFVPQHIPIPVLWESVQQQLGESLGGRVAVGDVPEIGEEEAVFLPPVLVQTIMDNAVQNANRATESLFRAQGLSEEEALEKTATETRLQVMLQNTEDKVRIFIRDTGEGLPKDGIAWGNGSRRGIKVFNGQHGYQSEGVASTGVAMEGYVHELGKFGGQMYLMQSPADADYSGATLVVTLPKKTLLRLSQE